MKKIEIGIFSILALGLVLRLIQLPGSGIFFVLGWSLLSMFYFYLSFAYLNNVGLRRLFKRDSYSGIGATRIILQLSPVLHSPFCVLVVSLKCSFGPGPEPIFWWDWS